MGRRFDRWMLGVPYERADTPVTATTPAPRVEAAARVALARRPAATGPAGWPLGTGPALAPFTFDGEAPPWFDRAAAMSLPTVSRSRNLICSAVSALPFTLWTFDASQAPPVQQQIPQHQWMNRPDPDRTRQWMLAWTVDDLYFSEVAHWLVTRRLATGYPGGFRRIPPGDLQSNADGTYTYTDPHTGARTAVDPADVVEFLAPIEGLLSVGWRPISIALQLDQAADRFAGTEIPAGVLEEQDSSEDLTSAELADLAAEFNYARLTNTTAATNKHVRYRETPVDASKMQLVEGRTYQALELARLGNVPAYLVGAPAGTGMTYQNGQQARQDLIDFAAGAYIGCIEQTLSGPNVTPNGQIVRLDQNAWLRNPFTTTDGTPGQLSPNDMQLANPTSPPDVENLA
jgi:hypothetical protein